MKTLKIETARELKSLIEKNRKGITNINGVEFGELYPLLEASNRYANYYNVDKQENEYLSAPFIVKIKN